jgi:hypothetical protein
MSSYHFNIRLNTSNTDGVGTNRKCHAARAYSHTEMRALHRCNGIRWSAYFNMGCGLAAKDVEQEFAR